MGFERKFIGDESGNLEEKPLTEAEQEALNKKRGLHRLKEDRTFVADSEGNVAIEGDNKLKIFKDNK